MMELPKGYSLRPINRIITAHHQREGAGFVVRRPFPTHDLALVDPFLLFDERAPADYRPGEAVGAPDHPHRGVETVTYLVEGQREHVDSAGHRSILNAGDVQWMTAGAGVIHSEMPSRQIQIEGGRLHDFQIWVNLPAREKMAVPRYQDVPSARIPEATTEDGLAHVRVIAGEAFGAPSVIETSRPIVYQDWTLQPGAHLDLPLSSAFEGFVYVFRGEAISGSVERRIGDGQLGLFGSGDAIHLGCASDAAQPARLLLLAGIPLREPIARYGPFIMSSAAEIQLAIEDYQRGRMGGISR